MGMTGTTSKGNGFCLKGVNIQRQQNQKKLNVEKQTRGENYISTDRQISLTGQVEAKLVLRKCDFENLCFVDGF